VLGLGIVLGGGKILELSVFPLLDSDRKKDILTLKNRPGDLGGSQSALSFLKENQPKSSQQKGHLGVD